ncbi:4'-phosphopantetheinyl transferase family protein [Oceanobacillus alkalisoli]|uniref:4'-phosphopantetheinyl transferase family protein n=1 Tax=Oceanobacillus alkalisoli TaxID=2925113 RepID=UPI001EF153BA|nr:4'-phosphopantetheinyl transferase superfamily protein [Oceanobacillus alkalisoli]MCF3943146.1 4'-phosphopantetheinyl transferase superfamily protein [Oceanobacillus alkalisoli]MCG5104724.1 4'-phosphopantetheinyl transferase superfamily protein [Oceanobacillus alkalisoli]
MEIYYCKIDGTMTDRIIEKWLQITKKERVKKIKDNLQKKQSLLGDMITRTVISRKYAIPFQEINYVYNAYRKPSIDVVDCHFNCSHSEKGVFVAFDNHPIGIDAEKIIPIDSFLELSEMIFTNKERNYVVNGIKMKQLDRFYKLWTIKEGYVKLLGMGLHLPLNQIEIDLDQQIVSDESRNNFPSAHYFSSKKDDYLISVVSETNKFNSRIQELTIEEIVDYIDKPVRLNLKT